MFKQPEIIAVLLAIIVSGCHDVNPSIKISSRQCFGKLKAGDRVSGSAILHYVPNIGTSITNLKCTEQNIAISTKYNDKELLRKKYNKINGEVNPFNLYKSEIEISGIVRQDEKNIILDADKIYFKFN